MKMLKCTFLKNNWWALSSLVEQNHIPLHLYIKIAGRLTFKCETPYIYKFSFLRKYGGFKVQKDSDILKFSVFHHKLKSKKQKVSSFALSLYVKDEALKLFSALLQWEE